MNKAAACDASNLLETLQLPAKSRGKPQKMTYVFGPLYTPVKPGRSLFWKTELHSEKRDRPSICWLIPQWPQQPLTRGLLCATHADGRCPNVWATFCCFPQPVVAGHMIRSGAARTWIGTYMGCQHPRWLRYHTATILSQTTNFVDNISFKLSFVFIVYIIEINNYLFVLHFVKILSDWQLT